ncbi:MAG: acyl-CoA dehydrogenase [Candidatus Heimdallarchaeota archaeon]|nr:acyl-CoA dehydrogenase [Candidatus Heimdallarchaeota archaeon]
MDTFSLSEDQVLIRETARDVAKEKIAPLASGFDAREEFPWESVKQLQELGFMAMMVSPEYGGSGLDTLSYSIAMEEISAACASTGVTMSVNNSLAAYPLEAFGTHEQKDVFLRSIADGGGLGAFGLSEPDAGSDAAGMKTTAILEGDNWKLNGSKMWITNGGVADVYIIFAKTDVNAGHRGISAFILKKGDIGFEIGAPEKKLGIRASTTTPLQFDECIIPHDRLLGNEGDGFKIAMKTLDGGRIGIASQALGIGQAAIDAAIEYAKVRNAFGGPIARFQGLQWKIADAAMEIEAARMITWKAARMKDAGQNYTLQAAMAKLYSSEASVRAADMSLQIHGGAGYSRDFPVERYYRDSKITAIYEGTSEILRLVIARELLGKY